MTETEIYTAPVRDGAMISAPVYESHKRGKNWMAIITPDRPHRRTRADVRPPRARGVLLYRLDRLVGQPVEFGAIIFRPGGKRYPSAGTGSSVRLPARNPHRALRDRSASDRRDPHRPRPASPRRGALRAPGSTRGDQRVLGEDQV